MITITGENKELGTASFSAMTYNVWGNHHLDERAIALTRFFQLRPADLIGVQELKPRVRGLMDAALPAYDRVHDDFPGWAQHSNIWWRRDLFELIEYGVVDVGMLPEFSRLFWTRLRPLQPDTPDELLFSTGHLAFQRNPGELADLNNRRVPQARKIISALAELSPSGPVLFTSDINDVAPAQLAFGLAGYLDSFTALGRATPATHPVPAASSMGGLWSPDSPIAGVGKGIDVIFSRGPLSVRTSEVVEFFHEGRVASDHMPVTAMFTFDRPTTAPDVA